MVRNLYRVRDTTVTSHTNQHHGNCASSEILALYRDAEVVSAMEARMKATPDDTRPVEAWAISLTAQK